MPSIANLMSYQMHNWKMMVRNQKSMQTFSAQSFLRTLRVMDIHTKIVDVRTKKCVFLRPQSGERF